ncbi:MAG TPA: hypothetical protein VKV35_11830 [Streptosporangiaceae bacterium]|nr:hypothetical protein [Streptosporangiaceae bacterium]
MLTARAFALPRPRWPDIRRAGRRLLVVPAGPLEIMPLPRDRRVRAVSPNGLLGGPAAAAAAGSEQIPARPADGLEAAAAGLPEAGAA